MGAWEALDILGCCELGLDAWTNVAGACAEVAQFGAVIPPSDAQVRQALDPENAAWQSIDDAMWKGLQNGKLTADYTAKWTNDLTAWKIFYTTTMQNVPFFTGQTMDQLAQYQAKRVAWAKDLAAHTGEPLPADLGQAPVKPATWIDAIKPMFYVSAGLAGVFAAASLVNAVKR